MQKDKIGWCFKLKDGIKISEPNEILSKSYFEESKVSLIRANKNFEDKDLLWATVTLYYAEYYALYSFLQKIGIKCENHSCSIALVSDILGEEITKTISNHKNKRIDAQYYLRIDKADEVKQMLLEAKKFVASFDNIISSISESDIKNYNKKINELRKR